MMDKLRWAGVKPWSSDKMMTMTSARCSLCYITTAMQMRLGPSPGAMPVQTWPVDACNDDAGSATAPVTWSTHKMMTMTTAQRSLCYITDLHCHLHAPWPFTRRQVRAHMASGGLVKMTQALQLSTTPAPRANFTDARCRFGGPRHQLPGQACSSLYHSITVEPSASPLLVAGTCTGGGGQWTVAAYIACLAACLSENSTMA